jgi:hypothetical protein
VAGQGFGRLVLRLNDDLHILWDLHPFTLRAAAIAVTISETTRATTLVAVTISTRAAWRPAAWRAVTTGRT